MGSTHLLAHILQGCGHGVLCIGWRENGALRNGALGMLVKQGTWGRCLPTQLHSKKNKGLNSTLHPTLLLIPSGYCLRVPLTEAV